MSSVSLQKYYYTNTVHTGHIKDWPRYRPLIDTLNPISQLVATSSCLHVVRNLRPTFRLHLAFQSGATSSILLITV